MANTIVDWAGSTLSGGRYKVRERLGVGSMGHVYRAFDEHLETEVVLKFPVAFDSSLEGPEFLERFGREVRSLVRLSHPRIVKIIDVGHEAERPFVVMQYLSGGTLKDRLDSGPGRVARPLPPPSLHDWVMEVAQALDFVHGQDHVHRDVKPGNILFDGHGNAFLADFGLIKALVTEGPACLDGRQTAAGLLVGTPNYIAPELVMGHPYDGRVDQYSLAMTIHEVLTGRVFLEGLTPSATMVNQTRWPAPSLSGLVPDVPERLCRAVQRGLSKEPPHRFDTCVALAREVLADLLRPSSSGTAIRPGSRGGITRGEAGRVPCPSCRSLLPAQPEHAGKRVTCSRCKATARVEVAPDGSVQLTLLSPRSGPDARAAPAPTPEVDRTVAIAEPKTRQTFAATASSLITAGRSRPRSALAAALVVAAAIVGMVSIDRRPVGGSPDVLSRLSIARRDTDSDGPPSVVAPTAVGATTAAGPESVEVNVAYGTEKKKWLEAAAAEFHKTPAGRGIAVKLHGMGSVEAARAVLEGPGPIPIHVWSPASSTYRAVFEDEWRIKHGSRPILRAEVLAMTPMVFIMWKERHGPFLQKYGQVNLQTVARAMHEPGGWGTIDGKPEWGLFKFSHTHPNKSNSGMLFLVMAAYELAGKQRGLSPADVARPEFQEWLRSFERAVARPGGLLSHSTGTQMKEMVLRGPSQYDCLLLYENLAIDYLSEARERWGDLQVIYPEPSMWNENPYYLLDVPWSSPEERSAAVAFLDFLLSEPVQRRALDHGFRPGNLSISATLPEGPLVKNRDNGLRVEVPSMCEPPGADSVRNLLASFRRIED